eukprot:XP_011619260.1 PREDICTED: krev interaction trapped protein 1-like [Takifugu rubripes]
MGNEDSLEDVFVAVIRPKSQVSQSSKEYRAKAYEILLNELPLEGKEKKRKKVLLATKIQAGGEKSRSILDYVDATVRPISNNQGFIGKRVVYMKKFPLEGENEGKEAPLFVVPVSVKDNSKPVHSAGSPSFYCLQDMMQKGQPDTFFIQQLGTCVTLITGGTEVMANAGEIRKTVAQVLCCVEKVSSFASSIDPIFGIVSSLVGVARKGLFDEEGHALDKDFQEINSKLESISQKNYLCLKKIRIDEVNETYGKYEEYIKHQYSSFNDMVARVKKDPDNSKHYMENFEKIYEKDKSDLSLDVYYDGIMGTKRVFGRALLQVYLDNCDGDREIMESHCSHIAHLFQIGLIALMAYTAVINHYACWHGKVEATKLLLEKGNCNPNLLNGQLSSPLHFAARGGHAEIVQLLLQQPEIDRHIEDQQKRTPLQMCEENKQNEWEETVKLLQQASSRPYEKVRIYRMDGSYRSVELKHGNNTTVQQIMEGMRLTQDTQQYFTIWICSENLHLQLKPYHKPLQHLRIWTEIVTDLTVLDPQRETPQLFLRRDVRLPLEIEKKVEN